MVKNTFFSLQGGVKNQRTQVEKMSTLNLKRISKTSDMSKRPAVATKTTHQQNNTGGSEYPSKMSSYNADVKFSNADDSSQQELDRIYSSFISENRGENRTQSRMSSKLQPDNKEVEDYMKNDYM